MKESGDEKLIIISVAVRCVVELLTSGFVFGFVFG